MDEDTIADLKQFISQQITPVIERLDNLEKKVDEGFAGVGDAISELSDHVEKRFDDHEERLTKLETQPSTT